MTYRIMQFIKMVSSYDTINIKYIKLNQIAHFVSVDL